MKFLDLPLGLTISDIGSMCSLMLSNKVFRLYYLRFVTIPGGVDGGGGGGGWNTVEYFPVIGLMKMCRWMG